jgi:uncharacterized membrane protein
MEFGENRTLLAILALVLALFAVAIFFYNQTLNSLAAGSCSDVPGACPHEKVVETQNIIIAALILVIGAIVAWIAYQVKGKKAAGGSWAAEEETRPKANTATLDADERKVVEALQEAGGSSFQSEVIKRLGYSKVKVSRILDKMEQKGLLERKRRGMANLVALR